MDKQEGGDSDAFKGILYPHLDAIICHAVANGLNLDSPKLVKIDNKKIKSQYATKKNVENLIKQMVSPASIWKRNNLLVY